MTTQRGGGGQDDNEQDGVPVAKIHEVNITAHAQASNFMVVPPDATIHIVHRQDPLPGQEEVHDHRGGRAAGGECNVERSRNGGGGGTSQGCKIVASIVEYSLHKVCTGFFAVTTMCTSI